MIRRQQINGFCLYIMLKIAPDIFGSVIEKSLIY